MKLPGRLTATTLGDVFGVLYRERATGTLELIEERGVSAGRSHTVEFEGGLLASVRSALPCDPLGEILKNEGFLDDESARRLRRRLLQSPTRKTGELLMEERLVTWQIIRAALRHQLKLRVDALFDLVDARVSFHVPRPRAPHAERPIPLSAGEFLYGRKRARARPAGGAGGWRSRLRAAHGSHASAAVRPLDPNRRRALVTLGLDVDADRETVQRTFRRLAAEIHPDRFPNASGEERLLCIRRFAELSAAYHTLVT
jgi:hypothetical protein